ncbi:KH homology domain-containing protein 4-like [Eucyclogobius newberryi]|uniref:KH homology domain-containing protein 4-like n=1 Tax=Eucyclogobius newberryi TaxID=166745 RepID=UPI003B5B7091
MSWGMTGQTPCLNSRWDKTAQSINNVTSNTLSPAAQMGDGASAGGVEKAAAMAAKINAMLMAKGKLMTPPPLLAKKPQVVSVPAVVEEMVVTEVDINDVPINSRDLLTKGKTQEEIRQFSGAVVTTKGHYMADAEKGKVAGQRPLYLQVQGKTQEQVNKAVVKIQQIIAEEVLRTSAASGIPPPVVPPLTLYPQPSRPVVSPTVPLPVMGHRPAAPHIGSFVHTKIFVGLDHALPPFSVKEKVEGPSGAYLGHIQSETGARVFLRGKGSGYIEQASKRESFEPLYVYISHPNAEGLESAKKLTENLLGTVRAEHARVSAAFPVPGPAPAFASHGYPPNSNCSNQGSWYNYPANGYAGAYPAAYPVGYWSNASAAPSQSNLSTTPPSPQAMVQYPMCPRPPQPYVAQVPGVAEKVEAEASVNVPDSGRPKPPPLQGPKLEQPVTKTPERPAPVSKAVGGKVVERLLMPPPPPPVFTAPAPPPPPLLPTLQRKRTRDGDAPAAAPPASAPAGDEEEIQKKKSKVSADASGLVPYGADSSDEEEEKTQSSKT